MYLAVFNDPLPRCCDLCFIDNHAPLHTRADQALGLGAGGGKAVFDEKKISAHEDWD
jgi:hypothetical protein